MLGFAVADYTPSHLYALTAGGGAFASKDGKPKGPPAPSAPLFEDKCGVRAEDVAVDHGLGWVFAPSKQVPHAALVVTGGPGAPVSFERDSKEVRTGGLATSRGGVCVCVCWYIPVCVGCLDDLCCCRCGVPVQP